MTDQPDQDRQGSVMRDALVKITRETGKGANGLIDWQRCVDRIQQIARDALARSVAGGGPLREDD